MDTLIYGGTLVTPFHSQKVNLGITNGKISEILDPGILPEAAHTIDAAGKYIIPGVIDEHVHFNDPGTTFRGDFEHGTAACAVGGITTAIAMPTNTPLILDLESLSQTLDTYQGRGYVDYAVHGGVDLTNADKIEELWLHSGIAAVKAFMCYSSPDMGWVRDDILFRTMRTLAKLNATMIIHAENNELISLAESELKAQGKCDGLAHCQSHPAAAEEEAIRRVVYFVEQTGLTTVIPHVSTAEGLKAIKEAHDRGVPVYAETCAQYMTFTEHDVQEKGPFLKFTPPVHSEENRQSILELLRKGYVNTIGSDHSPYSIEEKLAGMDCIWNSPNGIPGLEVLLPSLLNAVNDGWLTLEKLVELTSYNPAKLYQLPGKGQLSAGYDADLVIVDMEKEFTYTEDLIQCKNKWSPFTGKTFRGCPVLTMVRGRIVAENFRLTGEKGYGKYIERPKNQEV
ncbi:MAG: dihydroorotase family protein [Clostridiales bacterium]|nr:dihydroorotase family protein [Clostridiales bacterium]